jgi:Cu/Ag efflux pump CusA
VRPKAMTVAVIISGLLPSMFGGGTGSEVMRRIAAPMVGGMITAPMLSMLVLGSQSAAAPARHAKSTPVRKSGLPSGMRV